MDDRDFADMETEDFEREQDELRDKLQPSPVVASEEPKVETCGSCGRPIVALKGSPIPAWRLECNGEVSDGYHWHSPAPRAPVTDEQLADGFEAHQAMAFVTEELLYEQIKQLTEQLGKEEGLRLLRDFVDERDSELDMMRCNYERGTPESVAWHEGVKEMWRVLDILKRPVLDYLALHPAAQPNKAGTPPKKGL